MTKTNNFTNIRNSNFNTYTKMKKSLFKYISKNGFIVFELPKEIKEKIRSYGVTKIYDVLQKLKFWKPVAKEEDFTTDKVTYSRSRYGAFFLSISELEGQVNDKNLVDLVRTLQSHLKTIHDIANNDYTFALTFLYSLKDSKDVQGYHMDYEPFEHNSYYPFSVIFAFQDRTSFRFLSKSHIYKGILPNKPLKKKFVEREIYLDFGQYIIFHPFLIHSGMPHLCANMRLHTYCDIPEIFNRSKIEYNTNVFVNCLETRRSWYIEDNQALLKRVANLKQMKYKRCNNLVKYNKTK